ncbi:MAG: N-acetylmuramoyl-L-alanine amidase [bacterium]
MGKELFNKVFLSLILSSYMTINLMQPAQSTEKVYIKNLKYANNIINIETGANIANSKISPKILRMANPDRIIVDIPNSVLLPIKFDMPIHSAISSVSMIRAAQFSTNPNIVRVVIYSSPNTVKNTKTLSINKNNSDFILKLGNTAFKAQKPVLKSISAPKTLPLAKVSPSSVLKSAVKPVSLEKNKSDKVIKPVAKPIITTISHSQSVKFSVMPLDNKKLNIATKPIAKVKVKTGIPTITNTSSVKSAVKPGLTNKEVKPKTVSVVKPVVISVPKQIITQVAKPTVKSPSAVKQQVVNQNSQVSYATPKELDMTKQSDVLSFLQEELREINLDNYRPATTQTVVSSPNYKIPVKADKMLITSVKSTENKLVISGNGAFGESDFFTLDNPNRLVYDFENTTVSSPNLLRTYKINNKDTLKLGQFTKDTLRAVIETPTPEKYKSYLSTEVNGFAFSTENKQAFSNSSAPSFSGKINNIYVKNKDSETTSIMINSSAPVIYNFFRKNYPQEFNLELFNIFKPTPNIIASLKSTGLFKGVKAEKFGREEVGTLLRFNISSNTRVEEHISADGRNIELIFKLKKPQQVWQPREINEIPQRKMTISPLVRKIVIDAGHGGSDVGATRSGIYEKDITLDVAKKLARYLQNAGYTVVFTRNKDEDVSLKDRSAISNAENPDLFVSVHVNSSTSPIARGLETHWYTAQSKELAQDVQDELVHSVNSSDRGICNSRFYVINHTLAPSILVEIGFISNDNERSELLTSSRQEATARSIANGVLKYIDNRYKP